MKKTGEIWWKQEEREREERIGNENGKIEKHGIKMEKRKKRNREGRRVVRLEERN